MAGSPACTAPGSIRTALIAFDSAKAPIDTPRRAMGDLLGNAVRFGVADDDVLVAGEGIETMLSLRCVLPTLPMAAALSANHLAAMAAVVEFASALYRPRRRCRRGRGAEHSRAARRSCRHRGDSPCRHGWATSTKICTSSASTPYAQRCGFSSHLRTSIRFLLLVDQRSDRLRLPSIDVDSSVAAASMPAEAATTAF